jgi:hypothetical protein
MKTLSKESEDKLLSAIQSVCEEVDGGLEPTAAAVKVANEFQLTPNFIRLVSNGYNTGAVTHQRENGAGILDKLAEVRLVDADEAIKQVYADDETKKDILSQKQASASKSFRVVSKLSKQASVLPQLPKLEVPAVEQSELLREHQATKAVKQAYAVVEKQKQLIQQKRAEYTAAQDSLVGSLGNLAEAVKSSQVWSSADVGRAAESRFGAAGRAISHFLAIRDPSIKKASAGFKAVDWRQPPFANIAPIVKKAKEVKRLKVEYQQLVKESQQKEVAAFSPFGEKLPQEKTVLLKEAAGFLTGMLAGSIPRNVATSLATPKETSQLVEDAELDLSNPDDENIRRLATVQTMLSDFTRNDEVISGYEPEEVYNAYNELASLAPRLSTQPAAMRALLRKRLTQGGMEPFETQEVANMEKTISEAQNPRLSFVSMKSGAVNVLANQLSFN